MKLFECIDGLLVGTRCLAWAIAFVGIVASVVLFLANLLIGYASAAVFIASFFLSVGVTLVLLPKMFAKGKLKSNKKYAVGIVSIVVAAAVMGVIYFLNGGFPELNLIFA